jgi:hypothetical protein
MHYIWHICKSIIYKRVYAFNAENKYVHNGEARGSFFIMLVTKYFPSTCFATTMLNFFRPQISSKKQSFEILIIKLQELNRQSTKFLLDHY